MNPAYSIVFFTTASGAGYGLAAWLAALGAAGEVAPDPWLGGAGLGLASALVAAGLVSSTFHLGHPERAWRAFSQWRSSWLSREAVLAVASFAPMAALFWLWAFEGTVHRAAAAATALLAAATVSATAMIYASLRPIRAWANGWVVPNYLALAAVTGAVLLHALLAAFAQPRAAAGGAALASIFVAWCLKRGYWKFLDRGRAASTPESATGLGGLGRVRLLEPPATSETFIQREMGYAIARKHVSKLRWIALACAYALPFGLTVGALMAPGGAAFALAAVPAVALGVVVERWLFFAEARHAAMLYFGAPEA